MTQMKNAAGKTAESAARTAGINERISIIIHYSVHRSTGKKEIFT
jgi:hypothetical protein